METTAASAGAPLPSARSARIWPLGLIALAAAGGWLYVFSSESLATVGATSLFALGVGVLTTLAVIVWLMLFSGLPWKVRLVGFGGIVVLSGALAALLRVDGYHGDVIPVLTWRWAAADHHALPPLAPKTAPAEAPATAAKPAADFPQFLGPQRNGILSGEGLAPDWWKAAPKERWRRETGAGWSGFVVAGPLAYTQEQRGPQELVVCVELETGKERWVHTDEARFSETMGGDGPRATPTVAGGRVYAMGATGILNCLDAMSGEKRWGRNVLEEAGQEASEWGNACSPLVYGELVYTALGNADGGATAAFRCATGERVWLAGDERASYSSPIVATLGGREQLVVLGKNGVIGHDLKSGEVLWKFKWPGAPAKVATPLVAEKDRIFLSVGYGLGCKLLEVAPAESGKLEAKPVWENIHMKNKFTTSVIVDGHAYGLDEGRLVCLNLADGKRAWKGPSYGHGQVLAVDKTLLIQCESGEIAVAEITPEAHRELARWPALSSKTWNYPCLAGRYLLVRNDRESICYELAGVGQ